MTTAQHPGQSDLPMPAFNATGLLGDIIVHAAARQIFNAQDRIKEANRRNVMRRFAPGSLIPRSAKFNGRATGTLFDVLGGEAAMEFIEKDDARIAVNTEWERREFGPAADDQFPHM